MKYFDFRRALVITFVGFIVAVPFLGKAATVEELIKEIQAKIVVLQAQLLELQQQGGGTTWCHTFNTNLKIGDDGVEVDALIQALYRDGLLQSSGSFGAAFNESIASAVTGFQEKYRSEILTPNGLSNGTGYVGKSTRAKLNQLYGCSNPIPPSSNFSASPTSGSAPLYVQFFSNTSQGVVNFGDGTSAPMQCNGLGSTGGSTGTSGAQDSACNSGSWFTSHTYTTSGTFTATLVQKSACPFVGDGPCYQDQTPYSRTVGSVTITVTPIGPTQSLTVLSPNGGVTWTKGTTQTIKWQDNTPYPTSPCAVGKICPQIAVARIYDIRLFPYSPPCPIGSYTCPAEITRAPYTIANVIYDTSYYWSVGRVAELYDFAPDGQYTVQVCQSGTSTCDSSNAPFSIVAGSTQVLSAASAEIIGSQSTYTSGQTIKFSVKGVASDGSIASPAKGFHVQAWMHKLDSSGNSLETVQINGVYQSVNSTYNSNSGLWDVIMTAPSDSSYTYKIEAAFYCSNSAQGCSSGQINKFFTFTLAGGTSQPSITVLSPNGGETLQKGTEQTIKWNNTANPGVPSVYIKLRKGSDTYSGIEGQISGVISNVGFYYWVVPTTLSDGNDYRVRVLDAGPSMVFDDSNAPFSISSAPTCTITYTPSTITKTQTLGIAWTSTGATSRTYTAKSADGATTIVSNNSVSVSGTLQDTSFRNLAYGKYIRTDIVTGSGGTGTCSVMLDVVTTPTSASAVQSNQNLASTLAGLMSVLQQMKQWLNTYSSISP